MSALPRKRTWISAVVMSVKGHERICTQQKMQIPLNCASRTWLILASGEVSLQTAQGIKGEF